MAKKKGNFFKRLGRKTAKLHTKINRVVVPVVAAGAGAIGGAPAAAAVTALGAQASYYFRATQARNEGLMGRDARARGRGERKRVAIYGAIGGGAGMLGSGAANLIAGKSFSSALGATFFGQGGAQILGIDNAFFAKSALDGSNFVTAANLASQKASPVPGLVTQSQLNSVLAGGSTPTEAAAAAAGTGTSTLSKVLGVTPTLLSAAGKAIPGTPMGAPPTQPNDSAYREGLLEGLLAGQGGGGGGASGDGGGSAGGFMNAPMGDESKLSPTVLVALGLGALFLLA